MSKMRFKDVPQGASFKLDGKTFQKVFEVIIDTSNYNSYFSIKSCGTVNCVDSRGFTCYCKDDVLVEVIDDNEGENNMVKIEDTRGKKFYKFSMLNVGETFLYNNQLFLKVGDIPTEKNVINIAARPRDRCNTVNCISLEDGWRSYLPVDISVEKVNCRIIIED